MDERLQKQLDFSLEIDKEKNITRQTHLSGHGRAENDAEHAWHMAIMAYFLKEYANEPVDIERVMIMCLVHDLVEIYAGDTFAYDEKGNETKAERERLAADKIFSMVPPEQGARMRALWEEFDARKSADAKYAACMDSLQPLLHNTLTFGFTWKESGTKRAAVEKRMAVIRDFLPEVYSWVEANLDRAVREGWLSA